MLPYIIWDIDPEIFRLGDWPIRWYNLLFAAAFLVGIQLITFIFRTEKKPLADTEPLLMTMVLSTILGARLGHFLFYEPATFIQDPLRIVLPPYYGLASHGAAVGIILGLLIYSRRDASRATGQTFLWVIDRICITVALAGAFIRFGNLLNSEIFGKPTNVPWGFVFLHNQEFSQVPRHPTQLYESLSCLVLFFGLFWFWKAYRKQSVPGTMLGIFLVWVFGLRFVWEFFKENQEAFEDSMRFNMGQLLSIPAIVAGLFLILRNFIRPASLIPMALVIQSSSLCYKCDYQSSLPDSEKYQSIEAMHTCSEPITRKQHSDGKFFQNNTVAIKGSLYHALDFSPITPRTIRVAEAIRQKLDGSLKKLQTNSSTSQTSCKVTSFASLDNIDIIPIKISPESNNTLIL